MSATNAGPGQARPNFLVFITDQHRADHLGCAGNPIVRTPNIDDLARHGVRFERCATNNPICQPARATLFTGRSSAGHGVRANGIPLDPSIPTVTDALRRAGYRTHAAGKLHFRNAQEPVPAGRLDLWQLDRLAECRKLWNDGSITAIPPNYEGLETADYVGGTPVFSYGQYNTWLRAQNPEGPRLLLPEAGEKAASGAREAWTSALPEELHLNTWIADRSIDFLRSEAGSARPFFLWCSFPDPHHPYCPPRPWAQMYRPEDVALPNRREGELDDLPPHYRFIFETDTRRRGGGGPTRTPDNQMRDIIALTYGMISMVDHHIGRVMAEVDRLGLRENTVVIFLSDHGDMMGDHWMLTKGPYAFDGLLRVPFIWSWPAHFREGAVSDALVSHLDFAPTLLELAGIPVPEGLAPDEAPVQPTPLPGMSLQPLLTGERVEGHPQVLVENDNEAARWPGWPWQGPQLRTLITERYQVTAYPGHPYGELFDLVDDPRQLHNLWSSADHYALRQDLLVRLMEEIVLTDPLPHRLPVA